MADRPVGGLYRLGYRARWDEAGERALEAFRDSDLVRLDLDLPDTDTRQNVSRAERCGSCGQPVGYWATDKLTGLLDRWGWDDAAPGALEQARRQGQPVALLMIDLDDFKRVNDEFGHLIGDAVLRSSAAVIRAATRGHGLAGRYGGDEFLGLLPGAYTAAAVAVAQRIRDGVRGSRVRVGDGTTVGTAGCTASIGIAGGVPVHGVDVIGLLREADRALREAKLAGGDRVCVAGPLSCGRVPAVE